MNKTIPKIDTLSIFVYDSVYISEEMVIEVILVEISTNNGLSLNTKEIAKLRAVLRKSIGEHVDGLSDDDLSELGISMLQATAVVLKAKYSCRKLPLERR